MALRMVPCSPTRLTAPIARGVTPLRPVTSARSRQHVVASAAGEGESQIEKIVAKAQDKFEKSDNKAAIAGYVIGGFSAILLAEWLMHLPLLNALIGFPIQLVGLLVTPYLVTRYVLDGKDWEADIDGALSDITKRLPGL